METLPFSKDRSPPRRGRPGVSPDKLILLCGLDQCVGGFLPEERVAVRKIIFSVEGMSRKIQQAWSKFRCDQAGDHSTHLSDALMLVLESEAIKPTLGGYTQKNHVKSSRYVIDAHKTLALFPSWGGKSAL